MDETARHYPDWKAPSEDGTPAIWPAPAQLLRDTIKNHNHLTRADSVRLQRVPLNELRRRMRAFVGHTDDARPLIATGHQTELSHPGVWVKNALIHLAAEKLGGEAYHVAIDTDEPKHLRLRWPGGSPEPLTDSPTAVSWSGLLDSPSPAHLTALQRAVENAAAGW